MFLHLGQNTLVDDRTVIGVFDLDNSTVSKHTRAFLARAQREDRVVSVSQELPKSFVVCRDRDGDRVYLSQLSPATLILPHFYKKGNARRLFCGTGGRNVVY